MHCLSLVESSLSNYLTANMKPYWSGIWATNLGVVTAVLAPTKWWIWLTTITHGMSNRIKDCSSEQ